MANPEGRRPFSFGAEIMRRLVDGGFIDKMTKRVVIDIQSDEYPVMYVSTTPSNDLLDVLFGEPGLQVKVVSSVAEPEGAAET